MADNTGAKGGRNARKEGEGEDAPITIKKYANRRLYNTATSSYVTLDHLCQMVKEGTPFVVYDAKSGDDITRSVLTQIIVEEEAKGQNLLPINFLRQLITFYGDSLEGLVPRYLEQSMQLFTRNQEQMRSYMENALDGFFPFGPLEEMSKHNVQMMENAVRMFSPFAGEADERARQQADQGQGGPETGGNAGSIRELQDQIQALQDQVNRLSAEKQQGGGDKGGDKES